MMEQNIKISDLQEIINNGKFILIFLPKLGESAKFLPDALQKQKGLTGCTNECKAYDEILNELKILGFSIVGITSLKPKKANEFKDSIGVKFSILSDENFELENKFNAKTFKTNDGNKFYHRQSLIIKNSQVIKRFEFIENPQDNALDALNWIKANLDEK